MEVLVTGGSGFIGRNIVSLLKEMGAVVTTLDLSNKSYMEDEHITGDVRDRETVKRAIKNKEYVIHLAAVTSPPEFENFLGIGYEVNVMGTYNILSESADENVERVVLASSSSVYGSMQKPASEDCIPETYQNLYPASKLINEITSRVFKNYSLEVVALRYFNTYGYGENTKGLYSSIIWKFIEDIRNGRQPVIYGDGTQRRDFIYVKDTALASVLALKNGRGGESYNVGTGVSTDFNTVFSIISDEMGYSGKPLYVNNPLKSYQYFTQAVMEKSNKEL
ncbi:MAG: NAD-dependent epimerase/dehydratase family protein, partial [Thermoplasmatales archaeon]